MGVDLILESIVLLKTALLKLQCEVLRCHARGTNFLCPETKVSLNQTRQYFHIIFIIHRLIWWNEFFVNNPLTVEESDHHFVFFFKLNNVIMRGCKWMKL
jgi:hypothetical protein